MHLSDGRGGQRDGIKLSEELPRGSTELAHDHLGDRFGGDGRHVILELAQFDDVVGRQEVRTRAQDLTELDEGGPELLYHQAKMFGTGVGRRPPGVPEPAALERHQAPEPELDHHETEAVAGHRRRDLAEALMCREREAGPAAVNRSGSRWRPLWLRSAHDHFRSQLCCRQDRQSPTHRDRARSRVECGRSCTIVFLRVHRLRDSFPLTPAWLPAGRRPR